VQKALKNKEFLCLYSLALAFYEKMSTAECKIAFSYTRHNRKQMTQIELCLSSKRSQCKAKAFLTTNVNVILQSQYNTLQKLFE